MKIIGIFAIKFFNAVTYTLRMALPLAVIISQA